MLEPQSRRLLLESLQPPEGYRLDWAVGTTYSLDLVALLAAPVAFAFSDWQGRDGRPILEPLALLKAVRQFADRICLFCQAGKIYVPRAYQPLLANLEDSIVQANSPRGGSFHPKLWFLRYVTEGREVTYRVLCLSRNMTFDRSWDTALCLEGELRGRVNAYTRNHPLGQFVDALPAMSARGLAPEWRQRMKQLAHEIRRVEFEIPQPFDEMAFVPIGIGEQADWPFPSRIDQLLVVSPFVDAGFIRELAAYEAPMQLVSRPECLARFDAAELQALKQLWVLEETAEPEAAEREESQTPLETGKPPDQPASGSDDEIPLVGLHAKLFVADAGWDALVWTGSANATTAAFERNVEFLVQLRGKRGRCGVAALMEKSPAEGPRRAGCLGDLLQAFVPPAGDAACTSEEEAFERLVDKLSRALAAAAPLAYCEASAAPDHYAVELRVTERSKIEVGKGHRIRCWPISRSDTDSQAVNVDGTCWARFEPVSLLGLTAFFAFEIATADERLARRFVLNVPLQNPPANRREAALKQLLNDKERVLRFLLLLLLDHGARDFGNGLRPPDSSNGGQQGWIGKSETPLFESLVRALDCDPQRIDQVAQIIEDLMRTEDGRELLPADLDSIWQPIWEARRRQQAAGTKDGKRN